jgi:aryl-alcohol dehydrogenase-like predicted oxidoreductase
MKALAISHEQHIERFRCTQSYYSLAGRELEREIIPLIKDQNLGLLVWSPLAGGFLSGKFTRNSGDEAARRATFDFPPVNKEKAFDIIDVLKTIADSRSVSVAQVAIAWLLAQPVTTTVIIGARKLSQLEDNLRAVEITLSADELKALDEVSRLAPEYPAWMSAAASDDRLPGQERRFATSRVAAHGKA